MARPKKNGTYLNVCIETPLYERLEALCEDSDQDCCGRESSSTVSRRL